MMNSKKIFVEDDICEISNYEKLILIEKDKIVTLDYIIEGKDLKLIYVDGYLLKISGDITKIIRGTNNENI